MFMMSQFEKALIRLPYLDFIVFPTTNILFMMCMATRLKLLNIKKPPIVCINLSSCERKMLS